MFPIPLSRAARVLALSVGVLTLASAQAAGIPAEARAEFQRASSGETRYTDRAEASFRRLSEGDPANPVARAYLGAALSLQGRDAWMPWTKLKKVEQGLAQLDKALAMLEPAHEQSGAGQVSPAMETRLVAIGTQIALPDLFHRFEAARGLIKQTLAHPGFAQLPAAEKSRVYAWAAKAAEKAGEAGEAARLAKLAEQQP